MAKSAYQTAYDDWNRRIAKYQSDGVPETVYLPIANQDLKRIYSGQSSATMTNAESDVAVYSAWKGAPAVAQHPSHPGGLLGGIETVARSVIPDVGRIITGLPRGVAHLAEEVVTPSTYSTAGKDIGQALGDAGDPGKALRDLSSSQLLDLIPGLDVASKLTTPAGRVSLEQNPVSAALDVLPVAKPLGVGALAGTAARAADVGILTPLLAKTETAARAQELGIGVGQAAIKRTLSRLSWDEAGRGLSTILNQTQLAGEKAAHDFTTGELASTFKELGTTDRKGRWQPDSQAITAFTEKAVMGDTATMSAEELAVYDKVQQMILRMQQPALESGELKDLPGLGIYAHDSQVVAKHRAVARRAAKLDKVRRETTDNYARMLYQAADRQSRAERTALARRRQLTRAVTRMQEPVGAGRALPQPAALLPDWAETGKTAHAAHALAVDRLNQAKAEYERLVTQGPTSPAYDQAKAALKKANVALDKQLIKEPPAHLHPLIEAHLRKRVADAVTRQAEHGGALDDHIDEAGAGRLRTIGSLQAALKEIGTTPMLDRLESYVGKDELKAMLADSTKEALKLQAEGLAPLYLHKVGRPELDSLGRVHVARVQDVREEQLRHRLFNVGDTIMNLQAALTSQAVNTIERDGMQHVYDTFLSKVEKTKGDLEATYQAAEQRLAKAGKLKPGRNWESLMEREWVRFDFDRFGVRHNQRAPGTSADVYIPKDLARNLESAAGGGRTADLFARPNYQRVMRVFRTSVLYGPRHFAHVVIGGLMPVLLDHPSSILEWPHAWQVAHDIAGGRPFTGQIGGVSLPGALTSHFDYKEDSAIKYINQAAGSKLGNMLRDFWDKTGARPGEAMARFEDAAQSLYQTGVYLRDIKKGRDPMVALEHARHMVVNLDQLSPFERTIMKQVMPFYSFTRFATTFLVRLPFDHPLRVAILSRLSNQATEEWGTGLPLSMMSLFFFGSPKAGGNQWTVNLRNMNPFRSLSNQFTLAGFISSLNPILTAPFQAMGYNPLHGQQLYPEVTYDPTTGSLVAAHPRGGWMTAAEAFVPELGALDAYVGISDNFRSLKMAGDHSAQMRELFTLLNIPFAVSQYNIPQTRARIAKDQYKAAQTALSQFEKPGGGSYGGTIGRYNLIPYQGRLVTPQDFEAYWQQLQQYYAGVAPGAATKAVMPKPASTPTDTLAELLALNPGGQQ